MAAKALEALRVAHPEARYELPPTNMDTANWCSTDPAFLALKEKLSASYGKFDKAFERGAKLFIADCIGKPADGTAGAAGWRGVLAEIEGMKKATLLAWVHMLAKAGVRFDAAIPTLLEYMGDPAEILDVSNIAPPSALPHSAPPHPAASALEISGITSRAVEDALSSTLAAEAKRRESETEAKLRLKRFPILEAIETEKVLRAHRLASWVSRDRTTRTQAIDTLKKRVIDAQKMRRFQPWEVMIITTTVKRIMDAGDRPLPEEIHDDLQLVMAVINNEKAEKTHNFSLLLKLPEGSILDQGARYVEASGCFWPAWADELNAAPLRGGGKENPSSNPRPIEGAAAYRITNANGEQTAALHDEGTLDGIRNDLQYLYQMMQEIGARLPPPATQAAPTSFTKAQRTATPGPPPSGQKPFQVIPQLREEIRRQRVRRRGRRSGKRRWSSSGSSRRGQA